MDHPDKLKATAIIKSYPFLLSDPVAGPHIKAFIGEVEFWEREQQGTNEVVQGEKETYLPG